MKMSDLMNTPTEKAGLIPYIIKDGIIHYMFMVPSNPKFGGSKPSIAKGEIDKGETSRFAAVREAEEELGLIQANIKLPTLKKRWEGSLTGNVENYKISIFTCEVDDQDDFNKPHYETGSVHWLTAKQFKSVGRESQMHIINDINKDLVKEII